MLYESAKRTLGILDNCMEFHVALEGIWATACPQEQVIHQGKSLVTWANEIGSWENFVDKGQGSSSYSP